MRVGLELLRIIFIFGLAGGGIWLLLGPLYTMHETSEKYQWLGGLGVYALLFVIYRNRWQFSGWYKGSGRKRLPGVVTKAIVFSAFIIIALPWVAAALPMD